MRDDARSERSADGRGGRLTLGYSRADLRGARGPALLLPTMSAPTDDTLSSLRAATVGFDFLFAGCGGLLLGFSLMSEQSMRNTPTVNNVTQNLLLGQCPLTGTTASY